MQSHIGCNCAWHCELCAALCAHNCRKRLWSDHKGRGYVIIERKEEVIWKEGGYGLITDDERTYKGRLRAARAAKKGTSWTLLNDSNFWSKQVVHRYLQNNIWNFKTSISPWSRPRSASLFWAFFLGMVNIFILQKISPERDQLHLFCTVAVILGKFSAQTSSNFFCGKYGS